MRETLAKLLAALTAILVVGLAAAFSLVQNPPGRADTIPPPAAPKPAPAQDAPVAAAGRAVYDKQGCARCHSIGGVGSPRSPLDGVGARLTAQGIRDWTIAGDPVRARLSAGVAQAKQKYAALPEEELRALVEYLSGLR
jgi:mono/diheme cytochrome c family protein